MEPMEANVQTQPGKRLAEEPKQKKGGKGWKAAIGIIAAAVVVFYGACCVLANFSSAFFPHCFRYPTASERQSLPVKICSGIR